MAQGERSSRPAVPPAHPATPAFPGLDPWSPRSPYLVPVLLGLVLRIVSASSIPFAAEDAYITFRYAENWARGLGPVYNAGERVFGFSSPLWTAWLALGAKLSIDTLSFARASGIAFDLGALVLAAAMLHRERGRTAAWAFALLFAISPIFSANSILGMETSLFLLLLFAAATAVRARHPAAGVGLGLLGLVRPEGLVAAAVVGLGATWRDRAIALGLIAAGAIALGAYFGSPLPQSLQAKAAVYGTPGPLSGRHWIEGLVPLFVSGRWPATGEGQNLLPLALVAAPAALVGLGAYWKERRAPGASALAALAGLAVLAGYVVLGVPFFFWYLVVPMAAWFLTAASGLASISKHRLLHASLAVYLVSNSFLLHNLFVERVRHEAIAFYQSGVALRALARPGDSVLLEPLGHIGYRTGLRMIDEVGLVAPYVAGMRAAGPGWYADVVRRARPDWLVVREGFLDANRPYAAGAAPFRNEAERAAIVAAYELVPYRVQGEPTQMQFFRLRAR